MPAYLTDYYTDKTLTEAKDFLGLKMQNVSQLAIGIEKLQRELKASQEAYQVEVERAVIAERAIEYIKNRDQGEEQT